MDAVRLDPGAYLFHGRKCYSIPVVITYYLGIMITIYASAANSIA
jgi:hypothetical protein